MIGGALDELGQDIYTGDHASTVDVLVDDGEKMHLFVIAEFDALRRCDSRQGSIKVVLKKIVYKTIKSNPEKI